MRVQKQVFFLLSGKALVSLHSENSNFIPHLENPSLGVFLPFNLPIYHTQHNLAFCAPHRMRTHFYPQQRLLCHMDVCEFEFEFLW